MTDPIHNDRVTVDGAARWSYFFRGQTLHALYLTALVPAAWELSIAVYDSVKWSEISPEWCGISAEGWCRASMMLAVVHQVFVWLAWRCQLGWHLLTRLFGRWDFAVYCAVFFPLLLARPALVGVVAWLDRGSLAFIGPDFARACGFVLLIPALMAAHSVAKHFGPLRAAGADHFFERYRRMPLVKKGAFRWTDNAMYSLVFLGLWSIAFLFGSRLALVSAAFQHAYIWVHYTATEKPDMELLYTEQAE